MKVKVRDFDETDLKRLIQVRIMKARVCFINAPFATKVYVALKTGLTVEFISKHWAEISK